MLQYRTTGSTTEVKTNYGALLGYLAEHPDGTCTLIPGPGPVAGGVFPTFRCAHARLTRNQG
jgi:hypothetical protein